MCVVVGQIKSNLLILFIISQKGSKRRGPCLSVNYKISVREQVYFRASPHPKICNTGL